MHSYCAFLGHQPKVSLAELIAVIPGFHLTHQPDPQIAIFDASERIDPRALEHLGGTYALAERVGPENVSMSDGPQILLEAAEKIRGKITFGLRAVGLPHSALKENYRRYKDTLKRAGRSVRYVGNEHKPAAAVLLRDAGMLSGKHGLELTMVQLPERLWIGRTIAAQDVDAYTKRDMGKPARDTTTGLLPPKLAQIMLNLGAWLYKTTKSANEPLPKNYQFTIYDPFCGTGVIPIECLVRGWNVSASDVSARAVSGTERNLEWIRKEMNILKKDVGSEVWKQDATKPFHLKKLPDFVVTETTLGPALTKPPADAAAEKLRKQMERMEEDFLRNASATLPGVPLVCCWPFWRLHGGQLVRLTGLWEKLPALGYRATAPVVPGSGSSMSVLYRRNDQWVGREIVMLQPVAKTKAAPALAVNKGKPAAPAKKRQ